MIQLKIRVFGSLQTVELQKTKLPFNNIRFSVAESLLESASSCGHQLKMTKMNM